MGRSTRTLRILFFSTLGLFATNGCSCDSSETDGTGGSTGQNPNGPGGADQGSGGSTGQFVTGAGGSPPECVNLECQQVDCSGGVTTTVTGTVYDPSGTLPIYNVVVYVPNAPVDPVPEGLTCDNCAAQLSGSPLVSALTDTQGRFTLEDVPVGADIPLVIQIGKWRRLVTLPAVTECVENPLTDVELTRLPKSSAEGNLPRIALSTGSADPLFCLLRRLGIDDSEYGVAGSDARIHFYRGANGADQFDDGFGASPGADFGDAPTTLWQDGWPSYDIVMLSCEGDEHPDEKNGHRTALRDYIDLGGRVFATHYHYNWFQGDAPADMMSVASFSGNQNAFDGLVDIVTSFPKGMALADWLLFVDGASPHGHFNVVDGRRHTTALDATLAQTWVTREDDTVYFSFNAPVGAEPENQCGRMVFSDIHVSAGAGDASGDFPSACNDNPLTEQEKALLFMLFDLSACLTPDDDPPCPPTQPACGDPGDAPCNGTCNDGCCEAIPE
jgi:hypothetical protein